MSNSLDRLNEIVRQAEAKSRAQRIHIEIGTAAQQLRSALDRARQADQRQREVRPVRTRELDEVNVQEQQLKDLVKKVAQMKTSLEAAGNPEDLIVSAHREIEVKRRVARAELEEVNTEAEESKRELRVAMEQFQQVRADLDRLQPQLAAGFAEEDRMVREAAMFFPAGQLLALSKDVENGALHYGTLDSAEQYAQLKVWIGRYRRLQTFPLNEDEQALSRRIFSKLVGLSKEYEPGYIEAFQINFSCDWDQFVQDSEEQLRQSRETVRRKRENERTNNGFARDRHSRESQAVLDELKTVLIRYNLPDEGAEEFRAILNRVVTALGATDPQVLELVAPFKELIAGWDEFATLRRYLERPFDDETDSNTALDQFDDLLSVTRGLRVLLIGGMPRDDTRRLIERVFDFDKVDWQDYDESEPEAMETLERRARTRGVDLVIVVKSAVGDPAGEKFRRLCEQHSVACLAVEHGHSPAQIGDALRRGLLRTV